MKKNLIIVLLHIISLSLFAQKTKDNLLKIEYFEYRIYNQNIVNIDVGKLYVSKELSYYTSKIFKKEKKSGILDSQSISVENNDEIFSEILINKKEKLLTERLYEEKFLKKKYDVFEKLPKMNWMITKEQKKISNYICTKAKTVFRGRTYEVWYTELIPISSGPWKFNGLPGLILQAKDLQGIYSWELKSLLYPYNNSEINLDNALKDNPKYKKISFANFDKIKIEAIKNKIDIIKARNSNRQGMKANFEYSTSEEKEPINELRTTSYFE